MKLNSGETRLFYDALGQVTGIGNVKDGETISAYAYRYDGRGNIVYEEAAILVEGKLQKTISTYSYDGKSQLVESHVKTAGEAEAVITYRYDPAGNRLGMETIQGSETLTVTYRYDEAGRLVEENDSQNGITTYTYDKAGNLIQTVNSKTKAGSGEEVTEPVERHYIYDASDRLTAVTDKDTLLLAALYDGNDNRIFTMEYAPQLQSVAETGKATIPDETNGKESGRNKEKADKVDTVSDNTLSADTLPDTEEETEGGDTTAGEETGGTASNRFAEGAKAFWYGVLCQTADIFLPAPTPFKAWLHDTMGFTDDLDVLFTEEVYEVELAENNLTVNEAGSPFALLQNVFAKTNQQSVAADAYRQVTYLNDTTYDNTQVLVEYATNGSLGSTTTAYSFGVQRESFVETASGMGAGATIGGMTYQSSGTYYYTGTGSVANVTGSATNQSYTYTADGIMTAFAMNASATGESDSGITGTSTLTTNPTAYGTYGVYGYNGEYTHTSLGLQYLRARYLNVATGTFMTKDTYAGKLQDILSQNRYTYAENNPVGHSDPSGHAPKKSGIGAMLQKTANTLTKMPMFTAPKARAATQASISNYMAEQNRKANNTEAQTASNQAFYNSARNAAHKEAEIRMDIWRFNMAGVAVMTANPGMVPWIESAAMELEKANCAAYDWCINGIQKALIGKDAGRIAYGSSLILEGVGKVFGAAGLAKASTMVSATGLGTAIGIGGFAASAWLMACASADITQGAMEVYYGFQGDSLTPTVHVVKDSPIYGSNDLAYHLSTGVAASLGEIAGGLAAIRQPVSIKPDESSTNVLRQMAELPESGSKPKNVFPENPDDLLPEIPRNKVTKANGTTSQTIQTSDNIRIRAEQHPLLPGETYNPRHHGVHYHVEYKVDPTKSWNNKNNVKKWYPEGYTPGAGSGFIPGEPFPE